MGISKGTGKGRCIALLSIVTFLSYSPGECRTRVLQGAEKDIYRSSIFLASAAQFQTPSD